MDKIKSLKSFYQTFLDNVKLWKELNPLLVIELNQLLINEHKQQQRLLHSSDNNNNMLITAEEFSEAVQLLLLKQEALKGSTTEPLMTSQTWTSPPFSRLHFRNTPNY